MSFSFQKDKNQRILISLILIFIVLCSNTFAAGISGFAVAKTLMNPRALALGGAVVADEEWSSGASLNPANASGGTQHAGFSFAKHSLDLWSGQVSGSYPIEDIPFVNMSGMYLSTFNYGEFKATRMGEGETGEIFSAAENVISAYMAGALNDDISWGAAIKFLWGKLENETATGGALDLGVNWETGWKDIRLGAVVRNFGTQFSSYGTEKDALPEELLIGGCRTLSHLPLTIHAVGIIADSGEEDWTFDEIPGKPGLGFGVGGEFKIIGQNQKQPLFFRLGYRSRGQGLRVGSDLDTIAGVSFGLGFNVQFINFDYTFAPMGGLGDVHRFGIAGSF